MTLESDVLVRYERGRDPLHFHEPWNVSWIPEGGGPHPNFSGELAVRAHEAHRGAVLEITGEYAPPLGMPGRVFDVATGMKIASSTARTLLEQIASSMEHRYLAESS